MRLIDADELIKSIDYSASLGGALGNVVEVVKNYAKFMAQTSPTIKEKRTGKWIEHEDWYDTYYECSSCGEEFSLIEGAPKDNGYNYCPSCGAMMI